MTLQEVEQLILAGKEKKEIQGELTDKQYNVYLQKIVAKVGGVQSNQVRINYIKDIEDLFFASVKMHEESNGIEKFFWRNRMNHLGSVYSTYTALLPIRKIDNKNE